MRFTINPFALAALRAFLDERARRGENDDDPVLEQAWLDAICTERLNRPLLDATPRFTKERTALFSEAFGRGRKLLTLTAERTALVTKIEELDRAAAAL